MQAYGIKVLHNAGIEVVDMIVTGGTGRWRGSCDCDW